MRSDKSNETINSFLVRIDFLFSYASEFLEIVCWLDVLIDKPYESLGLSDWKLNCAYKQDDAQHLKIKSENQIQNVQSPRCH